MLEDEKLNSQATTSFRIESLQLQITEKFMDRIKFPLKEKENQKHFAFLNYKKGVQNYAKSCYHLQAIRKRQKTIRLIGIDKTLEAIFKTTGHKPLRLLLQDKQLAMMTDSSPC